MSVCERIAHLRMLRRQSLRPPPPPISGQATLLCGDCIEQMAKLPNNSVDGVVCDPPYHLTSIVERFGKADCAPARGNQAFVRASRGFMGVKWDGLETPKLDAGLGHWLAGFADGEGCFIARQVGGRIICEFVIHVRADDIAILQEVCDATEIGDIDGPRERGDGSAPMVKWIVRRQRDCAMLVQLFRQFPLRAKKARDFEIWASAVNEWIKHEPGTSWDDLQAHAEMLSAIKMYGASFRAARFFHYRWARQAFRVLKPGGFLLAMGGTRTFHHLASGIEDAGFEVRDMVQWLYGSGFPKSHNEGEGRGTALKPACEPICMARKPLSEGTVAANVLRWGTGAINIDGCKVGTFKNVPSSAAKDRIAQIAKGDERGRTMDTPGFDPNVGRWPANVITDGSDEVVAMFPDSNGQQGRVSGNEPTANGFSGVVKFSGMRKRIGSAEPRGDSGSAARFFYQAKATKAERAGSKHPTVKPITLLRYLCRLIIPPGGLVLDPFAGTGTLGEAAHLEGMRSIMIERETEYQNDIRRRMSALNIEVE